MKHRFDFATDPEPDFSDCFTASPADASADAADAAPDWPFRASKKGVQKRVDRLDKKTGQPSSEWHTICTELYVVAETRDVDSEDWGRLLKLTDRDGKSKTWAMPMALMAGDGSAIRDRLFSLGLIAQPTKFAREALLEYIGTAAPDVRARCVSRIGWTGGAFVLPAATMGEF